MSGAPKGRFTLRTAGALFIASAAFELLSVTSPIPLFGAVRNGVVALAYHLVFVGFFAAMGIGLWTAKPWGLKAVLGGTIVYTLDKIVFLLDIRFVEAYLLRQLGGGSDLGELLDEQLLVQILVLSTLLFMICWWGFAVYVWFRRDYFLPRKEE